MKKLILIAMAVSLIVGAATTKNDNASELEKYRVKYSELVLKWENSVNEEEKAALEKQLDEMKADLIQRAIKKYRSEYSDLVDQWDKADDHVMRMDIEANLEVLKTSNLHLFRR